MDGGSKEAVAGVSKHGTIFVHFGTSQITCKPISEPKDTEPRLRTVAFGGYDLDGIYDWIYHYNPKVFAKALSQSVIESKMLGSFAGDSTKEFAILRNESSY